MSEMSEPVDPVHAMCVQAIARIRQATVDAKMRVAVWDIRPMPEGWRR